MKDRIAANATGYRRSCVRQPVSTGATIETLRERTHKPISVRRGVGEKDQVVNTLLDDELAAPSFMVLLGK